MKEVLRINRAGQKAKNLKEPPRAGLIGQTTSPTTFKLLGSTVSGKDSRA